MCEEKERFKVPNWAKKPPSGSHLDVMKNDVVIRKLLVDEKGYYYFGRNPTHCDFIIEHASSSRVHALLLYHHILKKFALVDLKSSHSTFVKGVRIAPLQPVFLELNDDFHFGASTRRYIVRSLMDVSGNSLTGSKDDINLPEKEYELENLTNYNTMQNRRISAIPITAEEARRKSRPRNNVVFLEEEEIINPEDVDPSVGRFRNLVQTAVIGGKRKSSQSGTDDDKSKRRILLPGKEELSMTGMTSYSSVFGISAISAAPSLDLYSSVSPVVGLNSMPAPMVVQEDDSLQKKKYAKEAWPGRKSVHSAI